MRSMKDSERLDDEDLSAGERPDEADGATLSVLCDKASEAAMPVRPGIDIVPGQDLWVFGYGSLIWNPGFPFTERRLALLRGYHRKFCIYSHHHRGTPERPGLVLGLDRGGSCRGVVFRVPADAVTATLDYLWDREMISGVYQPRMVPVRWRGGRVEACTFVVDRAHVQYCGSLGLDETVRFICQGIGKGGPNFDYLVNTVRHLHELGIPDPPLDTLLDAVERHRGAATGRG
jgi:cation transport protein ChaC